MQAEDAAVLGLNSQPSTLNPQPSTLNAKTPALNNQPSTLNPQVMGRAMQRFGMAETGGGVRIRNWMRARLPPAEEALEGFRSCIFRAHF